MLITARDLNIAAVLANNTFTFPPKVLQQIIPKCTRKKKT
jgi:hypothetical protein